MPDAPAATASAPAAAPQAAAPKAEPKPYRFKFVPGDSFSIDAFLVKGYLEATVNISEQLSVTFRTLTVEQTQRTEAAVDAQNQSLTIKYIANEMTISQIYQSLQAMNGKTIPPIPTEYGTKEYKPETDGRRKWVRNLPGIVFDQITKALDEFERHAKDLISPENVRNF